MSPMQVYGDASLDAPNGSQIHGINLTVHLPLTLDATLGARCGLALTDLVFSLNLDHSEILSQLDHNEDTPHNVMHLQNSYVKKC